MRKIGKVSLTWVYKFFKTSLKIGVRILDCCYGLQAVCNNIFVFLQQHSSSREAAKKRIKILFLGVRVLVKVGSP